MMETDRFAALLEDLPPDLHQPPDRFEQVQARVRRRRQRRIALSSTVAVAALAVTVPAGLETFSKGAAVTPAAQHTEEPGPGSLRVTRLADPVSTTHTGTATVDLGQRPDQANAVTTALECLTPGSFTFPDGAGMQCDAADLTGNPSSAFSSYVLDLPAGQDQIRIEASEGASWRITTTYVSTELVPWGVNAKGETYGAENENGTPDLIAVIATNGRIGYAYSEALNSATGGDPRSPQEALANQKARQGKTFSVPVYESDGDTVIGELQIDG